MSQEYYQQQWREAQDVLKKNFAVEARLRRKGPIKDPETAKWLVGHLFMSYLRVVNRLDRCYDQLIQPQKREVLSRLLDLSLGRLLELKSEIVRIEFDDYCFFDNVLIELKLTHQDLEIHIPKYFWRDREKATAHRRELMRMVFEEAEKEKFEIEYLKHIPEEDKEEAWKKYLQKEEQERLDRERIEEQQKRVQVDGMRQKDSVEELKKELKQSLIVNKELIVEAISLIQRHERARQGRIEAMLEKQKKVIKYMAEAARRIPKEKADAAARVIQRHWRRHRRRRKEVKAMQKLQELLDMTRFSFKDTSKYERLEKVSALRRKMQDRNQEEYEEALVRVKEKMMVLYTIPMEEDTIEEIMAWFQWYFEQCEYLPDYPPMNPVIPTGEVMGIPKKLGPKFAEKLFPVKKQSEPARERPKMTALAIALTGISALGGSALVVAGHWIGPKEFLKCQLELEKMKKKGKDAAGVEKKPTKEQLKEMKKKEQLELKKLQLAEEAEGFRLRSSNYRTPLDKADNDYRAVWMDRDESRNPDQRFIYDFVKEEKCFELSMEIRKAVDEIMQLELEMLKDALERDKNPKKKKKVPKKPKKKKKNKKKKEKKDPTGDRTVDDLFMELFRNGIIRDYEAVYLSEYLGERSYAAFDMRRRFIDWPPSLGDVRQPLVQLCILPLGSSRIHQLSPLIKSVCLLGTENSGKEFLARIICTETASVMFDLTPENVVGKYPGKDGLKMLQHLIEKMTRVLQPSVIFVDGAEKTFYKKVPKEEKELDPKRLSKVIAKLAKDIKPEDQVLVLGVSSQPWLAQKKKFLKTYEKTIQIPQMDYGSYVKLWEDLLAPYHSVPRDFDVSCLARVSNGYSVKMIMDTVKNVITTERISKSRFQPYTQLEFLEELLKNKAVDPKLQEKILKFYSTLDLPKKRAKRLTELKEALTQKKK